MVGHVSSQLGKFLLYPLRCKLRRYDSGRIRVCRPVLKLVDGKWRRMGIRTTLLMTILMTGDDEDAGEGVLQAPLNEGAVASVPNKGHLRAPLSRGACKSTCKGR